MPAPATRTLRLEDLLIDVSITGAAQGNLLYRGASTWNNLAAGTAGNLLATGGSGANPAWASLLTYASSGTNLLVTAGATTDVPFAVNGLSGQSGDLQQWKVNGTALSIISSSGYVGVGTSPTSPIHVSGPASSSTLPWIKVTGTTGTGLQYGLDVSVAIGSGSNQAGAASILATMVGTNNQNGSVYGIYGKVTGSASPSGIGVFGYSSMNAGGKGLIGVLGSASAANGGDSSTDLYGGIFEGGSNINTGRMVVGVLGQARSGATSYYAGFFRLAATNASTYSNSRPTNPPSGAAALAADNGSSTADIFRLLDNNTTTFSVADGGTTSVLLGNAASTGVIIAGTTSQTAPLLQLQGRSSTTTGTAQAEIDTAWVDSTHATRKARLLLRVYDTAVREGLRIDADGTYALTAIGGGTVTAGAALTVTSPTTTYVPLVVDSPTSQSADLAQFKVNGTVVGHIAASSTAARFRSGASTTNYGEFYQDVGNNRTMLNNAQGGAVRIATSSTGLADFGGVAINLTLTAVSTTYIPLALRGITSQTAPLLQLQGTSSTTAGTAQAEIDTAWVDSTHATRKARLILRAYDTAVREGLRIDADGTYALTAIGGGTVTSGAALTVTSPTTTYVPLVVDSPTSQSGDLQQWKVNGTTQVRIASDGRILAPDGSNTTPAFAFGSSTGTGWYLGAGNRPSLAQTGTKIYEYTGSHVFSGSIYAGAYYTSSVSFVALNSPQTGMCFTGRSGSTQTSCDIWLIPGVPAATSAGSSSRITGSAGSGTNQNGGNVYFYGGAKTGTGLDGVSTIGYSGSAAVGNASFFGAGSFGSGVNVVFIANATTVPTTDPTGGGILYCEGGALKYRGSSGTITTLGVA